MKGVFKWPRNLIGPHRSSSNKALDDKDVFQCGRCWSQSLPQANRHTPTGGNEEEGYVGGVGGGKKEKRKVFAEGRDKGAPHAEARTRSVAVLFMLLLSQVLIVATVHHSQLPAWPKQ